MCESNVYLIDEKGEEKLIFKQKNYFRKNL
jgi:hypothetical protein